MNWEILSQSELTAVRRRGRFIAADLLLPHRVASTSVRNGGQTEHLCHLVNHQSCEGAGHSLVSEFIASHGEDAYHDAVCAELAVPAEKTAVMGTAANMNYAAIVTKSHSGIDASAIVTAGVQTNATCAGDPAVWFESNEGFRQQPHGTINIILLVNTPVTVSALARIVSVTTEGKSAALQQLAVPSCYSKDLATGTGTDQYCVAAPIEGRKPLTSASPHTKLGEIVGAAVREATLEALRWQNGLEPSYTRGLFHALGRYGITEQAVMRDIKRLLGTDDLELLAKNTKAVFYEPQVGAAAHALAAVLDRARHGTLPPSGIRDAVAQQATLLAVNLAARLECWPDFHQRLRSMSGDASELVVAAIALGWSEKWRRR